ncbi:coproporphyrinogen III oxidase [Candidatus Paracaedimonas acanthamoebae]|nr:coproporphyrinogen III oxidase [Candidatus Paracaedimonas acanthamoebae]
MTQALALYIHWPFCLSKCPYCDFNSHVREKIDESLWRETLLKELNYFGQLTQGRSLKSVFFGGGTPSLMAPQTVATLLDQLSHYWQLQEDLEITLEANPTSIEADKFRDFKSAGVNRVSVGIQALNDQDLKFLGRTHGREDALKALAIAKNIFDRFSFDLIYARPQQTVKQWQEELKEALTLAQGHLSLYQLTIEQGTAFYTAHQRKDFAIPDDHLAADLYEATQEMMEKVGLPAYEISNHARLGQESRHNLAYWQGEDYVGVGPGAHGRLTLDHDRFAFKEIRAPEIWMKAVLEHEQGIDEKVKLSAEEVFTERLMMGLRLRKGIPQKELKNLAGGRDLNELFQNSALETLESENFIKLTENDLTLTSTGLQRLNAILTFLLKNLAPIF